MRRLPQQQIRNRNPDSLGEEEQGTHAPFPAGRLTCCAIVGALRAVPSPPRGSRCPVALPRSASAPSALIASPPCESVAKKSAASTTPSGCSASDQGHGDAEESGAARKAVFIVALVSQHEVHAAQAGERPAQHERVAPRRSDANAGVLRRVGLQSNRPQFVSGLRAKQIPSGCGRCQRDHDYRPVRRRSVKRRHGAREARNRPSMRIAGVCSVSGTCSRADTM